ncbi:MAG: ester cyclase [Paracoccaceae bacterium]
MVLDSERLVRRYLSELCTEPRLDGIEAWIATLAHPDMTDEANLAFGGPPGRAGLVAHVKGFVRAIGDLEVRIDRIAAGRDETGTERAMACWHFSGRHRAPWLGRPASGAAISGTVVSVFTVTAGKFAHYRLWLCAEMAEGPVVFDSAQALARARAEGRAARGPA